MSCISQSRYFLGKGKTIHIRQHTLSGNFCWVPRNLTWVSCLNPLPPASHTYSTDLSLHPISWPDPINDAFCPGCSKGTARKCFFPALHCLSLFWVPSRDVAQWPSVCLVSVKIRAVTPISYKSRGQSLVNLWVPIVPCLMISSFLLSNNINSAFKHRIWGTTNNTHFNVYVRTFPRCQFSVLYVY